MLLQDLKKSLLQSLLGKYALYIFQMTSLMILARLIAPESFGIVATVQVIAMFFQTIGTSGLAPAVVYQEHVPAQMRDGVFSVTALVGIGLGIVFYFLAPVLFEWFDFENGLYIFHLLGIYSFFSSLSMMPLASLLKDKKFIRVSQAEILSELVGFILCISLYFFKNDGLMALAWRFVSIPLFRFSFYYLFSVNTTIGRPRFGRAIGQVKILYNYAKYQILFNMVNYCSRNLDNLLLAKYFGAATLGIYEKTYQIMRYPLQLFTFAITPALQPVLTQYRHQPEDVYSAFFKVASRLSIVGVFSSSILYLCSEEVIYILFGSQWLAAAPLLQILALSIPVQMIMSSTGGVFQAFGKMREMLVCGLFSSIVSVIAIGYGVYTRDLVMLCWALVLAFHINYVQCLWVLGRAIFRQSLVGFLLISAIIASGFVVIAFDGGHSQLGSIWQSILEILQVSIAVGLVCGLFFFIVRRVNI